MQARRLNSVCGTHVKVEEINRNATKSSDMHTSTVATLPYSHFSGTHNRSPTISLLKCDINLAKLPDEFSTL